MSLFNTIVVYRIGADWQAPSFGAMASQLEKTPFTPCGPTQELAVGWVAPRGQEHGSLLESVGGQLIAKFKAEKKTVPASAIKSELAERCKELEAARGRKVGGKEKREIKEELKLSLLPRAFSKESSNTIWLDPVNRLLVVSAGSHKAAELCIKAWLDAMGAVGATMPVSPLATEQSPQGAMSAWLVAQEAPENFALGTEVELKQPADKSCVKYSKHALELAEIKNHIQTGKVPTKLSVTWDGRVAFTFNESYVLSKITLLETDTESSKDKDEDSFDADVALMTGELSLLLPELLNALGGELVS